MDITNFRKGIFDTNVLLESLLINYLRFQENKGIRNRLETFIIDWNITKYRNNYSKFLDNIRTIITSSHAIAELSGLIKSRKIFYGEMDGNFWDVSVNYLRNKNLEEHLIKLLTISTNADYRPFIREIGFIDTGLIDLATEQQLTIVTNDKRTLFKYARELNIQVILLNETLHSIE
jgi:hypothetical protein